MSHSALGNFEILPRDVLHCIFEWITPKDLYQVFQVSKELYSIANDEIVWKQFFLTKTFFKAVPPEDIAASSWKKLFQQLGDWNWSTKAKANAIVVSPDGRTASRPTTDGMNCAVITEEAFSKYRNNFKVKIEKKDWIGIGVAQEGFVLNDSNILGSQNYGLNGGFFSQGNSSIAMIGCVHKLKAKEDIDCQTDDILTIKINYDKNIILCYCNDIKQATLYIETPNLRDIKIHPVANLSCGSSATLIR